MKKLSMILAIFTIVSTSLFAQGKVTGKTYFGYFYNSDGSPTNEFEIHRVYIGYQNKINDYVSYKITTDVGRFNTGKDDRMSLYLKYAMVSWKTPIGKFVFGLQGFNVFNVQENNWGYRFIEKSAMDKNKFASSADLGIGYYKKFAGKLNFSAIVSNGRGYKKSENDNYKKYSFQLFYGDSKIKKNGNYNVGAILSTEAFDYTVNSDTSTQNRIVFGGFAVYQIAGLRIGAEYDLMNTGGVDVTKNLISVYANYILTKMFDVFARFDTFDPNTNTSNDGTAYFLGGFNYKASKGLYIAPNVRVSTPEQGNSTTVYTLNFQYKI